MIQRNKNKKINIGVIGFGYWGPNLVRSLTQMEHIGARVVAVADTDIERRRCILNQYPDIEISDVPDRVICRGDIDAIVIATPSTTHYELAKSALLAGKHVLVEKPMTTDVASALDLALQARQKNRILMVGHTYEYNASVIGMRELIAKRKLGKLLYVRAIRVNLGPRRLDTNVIWDLAPHDVSILLHVLGCRPYSIRAFGSNHTNGDDIDVGQLILFFNNNLVAYITVSWLDPRKIREITFVGDQKMAVFDDVSANEKLQIYDKYRDRPGYTNTFGEFPYSYRYGEILKPYVKDSEPLRDECEHFLLCVKSGNKPRSDASSGINVVRILQAAMESTRNGSDAVEIEY